MLRPFPRSTSFPYTTLFRSLAVNNAGIEQFGYLWETPVENWQRVLDVNVTGVFNGVRSVVPRMAERSEEHTSELQSRGHLVCRVLLENKKYRHSQMVIDS